MLRRKISMRDAYAAKCREKGIFFAKIARTQLQRRKPIKKVSKSQRNRLKSYYEIRNDYLKRFPACGICLVRGLTPAPATEIHHIFGRSGSLLCDERGFCPSCRSCREYPHTNPKEAREAGILGESWQWGVPIDQHKENSIA